NDAAAVRDLVAEHEGTIADEQLLRDATVVDRTTAAAFVAGRLAERQVARRSRLLEQLPIAWRRLRREGQAGERNRQAASRQWRRSRQSARARESCECRGVSVSDLEQRAEASCRRFATSPLRGRLLEEATASFARYRGGDPQSAVGSGRTARRGRRSGALRSHPAPRCAARPSTITLSMNSKRSSSSGATRVSGPASSTMFGRRSGGSASR